MDFEQIRQAAEGWQKDMTRFLRDMIAIPSESCEEEGVAKRIAEELTKLGYDKVEFDKLGNVIGWLGEGRSVYFHCAGGADRTGSLAFLIEGLLGVSEEDLSKDYEVTYYSGSNRKRNSSTGWFYKPMIRYIRTFAPGKSINEQITAWAKTRYSDSIDPLTDLEIEELQELLLE